MKKDLCSCSNVNQQKNVSCHQPQIVIPKPKVAPIVHKPVPIEHKIIPTNPKIVPPKKKIVPAEKKIVSPVQKIVPPVVKTAQPEEKIVQPVQKITPQKHKIVVSEQKSIPVWSKTAEMSKGYGNTIPTTKTEILLTNVPPKVNNTSVDKEEKKKQKGGGEIAKEAKKLIFNDLTVINGSIIVPKFITVGDGMWYALHIPQSSAVDSITTQKIEDRGSQKKIEGGKYQNSTTFLYPPLPSGHHLTGLQKVKDKTNDTDKKVIGSTSMTGTNSGVPLILLSESENISVFPKKDSESTSSILKPEPHHISLIQLDKSCQCTSCSTPAPEEGGPPNDPCACLEETMGTGTGLKQYHYLMADAATSTTELDKMGYHKSKDSFKMSNFTPVTPTESVQLLDKYMAKYESDVTEKINEVSHETVQKMSSISIISPIGPSLPEIVIQPDDRESKSRRSSNRIKWIKNKSLGEKQDSLNDYDSQLLNLSSLEEKITSTVEVELSDTGPIIPDITSKDIEVPVPASMSASQEEIILNATRKLEQFRQIDKDDTDK